MDRNQVWNVAAFVKPAAGAQIVSLPSVAKTGEVTIDLQDNRDLCLALSSGAAEGELSDCKAKVNRFGWTINPQTPGFEIMLKGKSKCLTHLTGFPVLDTRCAAKASQVWQLWSLASGAGYTIRLNSDNTKCLVHDGTAAAGSAVKVEACNAGSRRDAAAYHRA